MNDSTSLPEHEHSAQSSRQRFSTAADESPKRKHRACQDPLADWADAFLAAARAEKRARPRAERDLRRRLSELDTLTLQFCKSVEAILHRTLQRHGFHQHHRQWRRTTIRTYRRLRLLKSQLGMSAGLSGSDAASGTEHSMSASTNDSNNQHTVATVSQLRDDVQETWLRLASSDVPVLVDKYREELEQRRRELGWENRPSLERLLIDRIVLLELQVQHSDLIYGQLLDASLAQAKFLVLRSAKLEMRLRTMVTALANKRKLLPNWTRDHDRDDSRERKPSPQPMEGT